MLRKLLSHYKGVVGSSIGSGMWNGNTGQIAKMAEMRAIGAELKQRFPNSVALKGYKVYSQNDEDGIIAAIFAAIGGSRTFFEIGVEDGRECNTHYLSVQGWRGVWVEANEDSAKAIGQGLNGTVFPGRFKLVQDFAKVSNIVALYRDACEFCSVDQIDLFSLDIDGNDIYVLGALLQSGARPAAICVEYNGKFPPPLNISVTHDDDRGWAKDDYFCASLQAFCDELFASDYALVGCNLSGTNAFFVKKDRLGELESYSPDEAWQPMRPYLTVLPAVHLPTLKFMRDVVRR